MNIEKLITFVTIADEKSISKAAEKLHMTQSAASQQISSLEKNLGLNLLVRNGRNVILSEEAEEILPYARCVIEDYDRFSEMVNMKRDNHSPLRIIYTGYVEQEIISSAISQIKYKDPVTVSLRYSNYKEAFDSLSSGQCDLVISVPDEFKEEFFYKELITSVEIQVIAKKGTFLSDSVKAEDLKYFKFFVLNETKGVRVTDVAWRFASDSLHIPAGNIIACDSIESQMLLVESGKGISMMPVSSFMKSSLQFLPIRGKKYFQEIVGVYIKPSEEIKYFLSICKKALLQQ